MGATNDLENYALNAIFAKVTFPAISALWLGLFRESPGETGLLTSEVSNTGNYSRVTLHTLMSSSSVGAIANATDIIFPVASSTWGTVSWLAVVDTSTYAQGRIYLYQSLVNPVHISLGETFRMNPSNLVFTCD